MKKILTFCAALWTTFTAAYGQEQKHKYQPWAQFKGDTALFLRANFSQNKFFDGKSLETVFKILDKELPVKSVTYSVVTPNLQYIEFILDHRKTNQFLNQIHFSTCYFDSKSAPNGLDSIFKTEPGVIVRLTPSLRKSLGQIHLTANPGAMIFSIDKLVIHPEALQNLTK